MLRDRSRCFGRVVRERDQELVRARGEQAEDVVLRAREIGEAIDDDQVELSKRTRSVGSQGVAGGAVAAVFVDESVRR